MTTTTPLDPVWVLRGAASRGGGTCATCFVAFLVILIVATIVVTMQQGAETRTTQQFAARFVLSSDDDTSTDDAGKTREEEEEVEEAKDAMSNMNDMDAIVSTIHVARSRARMVHVGKTGGQTVREFFIQNMNEENAKSFQYTHVSRVGPNWFIRDWLKNNDTITFVSVRDPIERLASAYNYRKHTCNESARGQRMSTSHSCSIEERLLFNYCFTTLDAFATRECDGYLCHRNFTEDELPNIDEADICNKTLNQILLLSAPDASPPPSGHIGMGLAWYFSLFEADLLDTVIRNTDTSMSPLWVVRHEFMSEDINLMNEANAFRDKLLITKLSSPKDKSDLRRYIEYASLRNVSGVDLGHWNSDYDEKKDSYISERGQRLMRQYLRRDLEIYDMLVEQQRKRVEESRNQWIALQNV